MRWVVVGAGSAGCVVARRLVDRGGDVVLVEAGPALNPGEVPASISGPDSFAAMAEPGRIYPDLLARRTAMGKRSIYLRGRGQGGSSAVNAMVALRGDERRYASWGWTDTAQWFDRIEVPLTHTRHEELGPISSALLHADSRAELALLTRRDGKRITSAEAYLWPVADRLTMVTDGVVDRVAFDASGCATGVLLADGSLVDADAVALCAGAIHTPAILLRSGLTSLGVGEGLQDHAAVGLTLQMRERAGAGGLMTGALLDLDPIQVLPIDHLGPAAPPDLAMLLVALMRPQGAGGTVRLRTDDPHGHPEVDFDLLSDERDLDALCAGVEAALALLRSPPFDQILSNVLIDDVGTPSAALYDRAAIASWARRRGADYVHASCSASQALGSHGAVIDHDGLFVADASAFPAIPNVNTHLPTMMLAERFVARWAVDRAG